MGRKALQLKGRTFGRLTALARTGTDHTGKALWECLCSCGNTSTVTSSDLNGGVKSCGCLLREIREHGRKHGYARKGKRHPLYQTWDNMKSRCHNSRNPAYESYGGRGITICPAWKNSFSVFLDDMGDSWAPGLTLDRIDNSKGYRKSNCRWATRREQSRNRRKVSGLPLGVVKKGKRYTSSIVLGVFDTPEEAHEIWIEATKTLELM